MGREEICRGAQGKQVVRLKGGCPSVFSRAASEVLALAGAGVPFRLVPGVSSALAAPLLAGAPPAPRLHCSLPTLLPVVRLCHSLLPTLPPLAALRCKCVHEGVGKSQGNA